MATPTKAKKPKPTRPADDAYLRESLVCQHPAFRARIAHGRLTPEDYAVLREGKK